MQSVLVYNQRMQRDQYGNYILTENDLCKLYLADRTRIIDRAIVDKEIKFDPYLEINNAPELTLYEPTDIPIEEYDARNQANWFMPADYKQLDIVSYVLDKCVNDEQRERVGEELLMYLDRDLFMLLRYCVYLVDTMRKNSIVCGLGRGSSVSSYVLFLIGIHKVDSIKYGLDIGEFLK